MIIECPQCSQRIDLAGSDATSFACPTCNTEIKLEATKGATVSAEERTDPSPKTEPVKNGKKTDQVGIPLSAILKLLLILVVGIPLGKCMGNVFKDMIAKSQGYDSYEAAEAWRNQQSSPPRITPGMIKSSDDSGGVPPTSEGIIGTWEKRSSRSANRQGVLFGSQAEYFKFSSDQKFEHGNIPQPLVGTRDSMTKGDYQLDGDHLQLSVDGSSDRLSYRVWMKSGDLVVEMPGHWHGSKLTVTYRRIRK